MTTDAPDFDDLSDDNLDAVPVNRVVEMEGLDDPADSRADVVDLDDSRASDDHAVEVDDHAVEFDDLDDHGQDGAIAGDPVLFDDPVLFVVRDDSDPDSGDNSDPAYLRGLVATATEKARTILDRHRSSQDSA
jgi:hypothetical protein